MEKTSYQNGKPSFAVIHDTGNPNTTAQDNVNYYKTLTTLVGRK